MDIWHFLPACCLVLLSGWSCPSFAKKLLNQSSPLKFIFLGECICHPVAWIPTVIIVKIKHVLFKDTWINWCCICKSCVSHWLSDVSIATEELDIIHILLSPISPNMNAEQWLLQREMWQIDKTERMFYQDRDRLTDGKMSRPSSHAAMHYFNESNPWAVDHFLSDRWCQRSILLGRVFVTSQRRAPALDLWRERTSCSELSESMVICFL
jgi:hypothetical protein